MFCFVSVLSWVVAEVRLKGEIRFPVTVLHRTGSQSVWTYLQLWKLFLGGENLADLILDPVGMLSSEGDILIPVINLVKT